MGALDSKNEIDIREKRLKFIKKIQQSSTSSASVDKVCDETPTNTPIFIDDDKGDSMFCSTNSAVNNLTPPIQKFSISNNEERLIILIEKILKVSFGSDRQQDESVMPFELVEGVDRGLILDPQYMEGVIIEIVKSKSACGAVYYLMECFDKCLAFETSFQGADIYMMLRRFLVTQLYMVLIINEKARFCFVEYIESVCSKLVNTVNQSLSNFKVIHCVLCQLVDQIPLEDQFNIFFDPISQLLGRLRRLTLMDDFIPSARALLVLSVPLNIVIFDDFFWSERLENAFLTSIAGIRSMYVPNIVNKLTPVNMVWSSELTENLRTVFQSNSILRAINRDILKSLVKNSELRFKMFQWVNDRILKNNFRRTTTLYQLQVDSDSQFYDNMFCNLTEWFAELCLPMADKPNIFSLINLQYLKYYGHEGISTLWGENLSLELEEGYTPSFVSFIFFSTHLLIHQGLMPVIQRYYAYLKELNDQNFLMNNDSMKWVMQTRVGVLYSMRARLLDSEFVRSVLQLCKFTANWYISLNGASIAAINNEDVEEEIGGEFCVQKECEEVDDGERDGKKNFLRIPVPEFIMENICGYLLFLSKSSTKPNPLVIDDLEWEFPKSVLELSSLIIGDSSIRNYHLRYQYVEVLVRVFFMDQLVGENMAISSGNGANDSGGGGGGGNEMQAKLRADKEAVLFGGEHTINGLLLSLFKLYYDTEHKGGTNDQFYDKFPFRYHIGILVCKLLTYSEYVCKLKKLEGRQLFGHCLNYALNDALFLLDELIIKLRKLKELKGMLKNLSSGSQADNSTNDAENAEKTEIEQEILRLTSHTDMFAIFGQKAIYFIKKLTKFCSNSFTSPNMVDQLARMLNYFLYYLTGKKIKDISFKQENQKLKQKLRKILSNLIQIYLNCWNGPNGVHFVDAIAKEARSFNINMFTSAVDFIQPKSIISDKELEKFKLFVDILKDRFQILLEKDNFSDDIPEEFTDSILSTLMTDPILLPSGNNVDRSTIIRHLSGHNATDPFTRKPLNVEMLKPNTELKQKIQLWLQQRSKQ